MKQKKALVVTLAVLGVGFSMGLANVAEAADTGEMSQSDKSKQPGLPDPGTKQRTPSADPTDRRNNDPSMGKAPGGTPGGSGPTAPGSGSGMGNSGGGSTSGGAGGAAGGASGGGGGR